MKIEENVLIIDESLNDNDIENFLVAVSQDEIEKIVIKNDDLVAGIVQILWCESQKKFIECKSSFLKKFFENVKVG